MGGEGLFDANEEAGGEISARFYIFFTVSTF
jgi:hypothetical protein